MLKMNGPKYEILIQFSFRMTSFLVTHLKLAEPVYSHSYFIVFDDLKILNDLGYAHSLKKFL